MYAVIRAGGKQYRVSPGDVVRVERSESHVGAGDVSFEVLAVSGGEGQISNPSDARVLGQVLAKAVATKSSSSSSSARSSTRSCRDIGRDLPKFAFRRSASMGRISTPLRFLRRK